MSSWFQLWFPSEDLLVLFLLTMRTEVGTYVYPLTRGIEIPRKPKNYALDVTNGEQYWTANEGPEVFDHSFLLPILTTSLPDTTYTYYCFFIFESCYFFLKKLLTVQLRYFLYETFYSYSFSHWYCFWGTFCIICRHYFLWILFILKYCNFLTSRENNL